MALLSETIQKQVRQALDTMQGPVKLVFFTQGEAPADGTGVDSAPAGESPMALECGMCADTHTLLQEVAGLSEKIQLEVYDFLKDKEIAEHYQVDKIPATVVLGGSDYQDHGVRLYGIPSGYEFGTLIQDILMASKGKPDLSEKTLEALHKLDKPVHIQVYTTPT